VAIAGYGGDIVPLEDAKLREVKGEGNDSRSNCFSSPLMRKSLVKEYFRGEALLFAACAKSSHGKYC
jgi:hypothetical protein